MEPKPGAVTQLLHQWQKGDRQALDEVTRLVYAELRRLATAHLRRERSSHTLQPTALVNEAYMRLCGNAPATVQDRAHFLASLGDILLALALGFRRRVDRGVHGLLVHHVFGLFRDRFSTSPAIFSSCSFSLRFLSSSSSSSAA